VTIEINNYVRWGIGIIVTIILALVIHIGNEGSVLKQRLASTEANQAAHTEAQKNTDKKIDRIEDKLDRLIESK
jgi:hypothetical protein